MRVLAISGSLRGPSHNTRLLRAAGALIPDGSELVVYEGDLRGVPAYDEEAEANDPRPAAIVELDAAIAEADAVLFSTPEYNGSFPGQLKNVLDWVSRPREDSVLVGKPVAAVGASVGLFGAVWAQADLRRVLTTMGAEVVDRELPVGQAHEAFGDDGALADADHVSGLEAVLADLVDAARADERVAA